MNIIVIPAYEPGQELAKLTASLKILSDAMILVVNDGSGLEYDATFEGLDPAVRVIGYPKNRGKGFAIKYALRYIADQDWEEGFVVTADADGQHRPADILRVLAEAKAKPGALVLGSRAFDTDVPRRSRFGNTITRGVFFWASGRRIRDTQTGLRAFSAKDIPFMISVGGERYEYEMNVLLDWTREGGTIHEITIETVYLDASNSCSHFRVMKDSMLIYWQILRHATSLLFALSSFASFLFDYVLFLILMTAFNTAGAIWGIVVSNILARAVSAVFNYQLNRLIVFKSRASYIRTGLAYAGLAVCILAGNSVVLTAYTNVFGMEPALAKIFTELTLFITSYVVQKQLIFRSYKSKKKRGNFHEMEPDKRQRATGEPSAVKSAAKKTQVAR